MMTTISYPLLCILLLLHSIDLGNGHEIEEGVKGTVKWYKESKGYGFITRQNALNKKDIFIHFSDLKHSGLQTLKEGDKVSFDVEHGKHGPRAVNVQIDA